jgi:hypothetical protein
MSDQMTSRLGAGGRCTHILWPEKASEQTPRGVIPPSLVEIAQNASWKVFLQRKSDFAVYPLFSHRSSLLLRSVPFGRTLGGNNLREGA